MNYLCIEVMWHQSQREPKIWITCDSRLLKATITRRVWFFYLSWICYCILARPHESHSRGTAMPIELRQKTDMDHNNFLGKMPWLQSFSPPNVRFPQSTSQHWRRPTASGTGNFRAPVGCSRRTIFSLRFAFPTKPATDLLTHLEVRQWRIDNRHSNTRRHGRSGSEFRN